MRLTYGIGTLLTVTALVACLSIKQTSFLFFVLTIECAVIALGIELLHRRIPRSLLEASSDNCSRIDGSLSARRQKKEHRARLKMRLDLLAVFLLVALTGNWLAFFIHYEIIPIPLAIKSITAFDVDQSVWKQNLQEQRIDTEFEQWTVAKTPATHEQVETDQRFLWYSWPLVVCVVLAWILGSALFVSRAYIKILREFAVGVAARKQLNLNRDITRLQSDELRCLSHSDSA